MTNARSSIIACIALLGLLSYGTQSSAKEQSLIPVSREMQAAAISFLESLDANLRRQAAFEFTSDHRIDWHFVPKDRVGVSFKQMSLPQRRAARVLMRSVLSEKGYLKATTIMSLEQVLRLLEKDRKNVNDIRDPEKYWFALFGEPASDKPWGWRVEGHHLSLNFTSVDGKVASVTPLFLGSNPAEVRIGPQIGLRALGDEEDRARELMESLTETQRRLAIISPSAPADVLTVPGKPVDLGQPEGIAAAQLDDPQRAILRAMIESFAHHLEPSLARREVRRMVKTDLDSVHFAWAGSLDREQNHYFRLHGPTFVLEYDNAQGNHAHLVWHSSENDFAAKVLHQHYRNSPHHSPKEDSPSEVKSR